MEALIDCIHCYLKQAISCMEMVNIPDEEKRKVLYELMDFIKTLDPEASPAYNSSLVLLKTYEIIKSEDPYYYAKKQSNALALELYEDVKKRVFNTDDPLYNALKAAVAGNVIDLGIKRDFDVKSELSHAFEFGFSIDDYLLLKNKIQDGKDIVIAGDNAGEIVFDKILVEVLNQMGKNVYYIVKTKPILNDSTLEDAKEVGMDKIANVVDTGVGILGIPKDKVSSQVKQLILSADIIISKGQANFESIDEFEEIQGNVFYLLKIKCEFLAKKLGFKLGDLVLINGENVRKRKLA
ncbi:damage-control phosphatase ARMT1 family protein [Caldicellulosiruptor naganoensis]|uniref:ARMT1-like domain-containing protein n=1 Tax=Caldicellulosiruptor naganoensis TaxID=29324 RepID=A0ABY7BID2_9FIRM|nr:ARMT1-like domain-containing protein [Caldicellulosiruptor naganoensis]WAM32592.1 ARMT1-like domain-containing protein [Caldicellulosiruptor naganoensis]